MLFAGGKVFGSVGFVIDPVLGVQLGMIPWVSKWAPMGPQPLPDFAVSPDGSRVYNARPTQVANEYAIDCFDAATRTLSGSVSFTAPGLNAWPNGVTLYGTHGAAVPFPGALVLLPDALSAPGCSPTPP
jgi:hypothetical protein